MPLDTLIVSPTPPSLKRRLASMLYETMLLFGVVFVAGWLFSTLLEQKHALYLRNMLQDWLFVVIGLYFIWFWTHGGQTLAMKTWRLKIVTADGEVLGYKRAFGRYLLSWLWILPGLAAAWALNAKAWMLVLIPLANVVLWALTAYLDPQRRFLHDRISGTRVVQIADKPAPAQAAA